MAAVLEANYIIRGVHGYEALATSFLTVIIWGGW